MTDPSPHALHDAAIFCLGMAAAIHESALDPEIPKTFPLDLDAIKDLESVYWNHWRAPLSAVSSRLSALHRAPVQYRPFVRPNAHLICFDFARSVLDTVWLAVDPEGFERAGATGFDGSTRIDFKRFAERWPAIAKGLRSLELPDHRAIASAVEQESARLSYASPAPKVRPEGTCFDEEKSDEAAPAVVQDEVTPAAASAENAWLALMRVFTNGLADDRIKKATRLLADGNLTVNEKLTEIDALIPFPATASAEQLGEMLGVTKQAVLKTPWWVQNRKGEKESEVGRRREGHRKRAKNYEGPGQDDDD